MKYIAATICLMILSASTHAANSWYWGKINQLVTTGSDGSFEVYVENQTILNKCKWQRVYFMVDDMGIERTKAAYSMALAAFISGKQWGVVIDMPTTVDVCSASSTASQGAGIR